jgi:hypothetical protein
LGGWAYADLVEIAEHITRVGVDAVRSSALELFPAVTAREKTHAECAGTRATKRSHTLSPTTTASATSIPSRLKIVLVVTEWQSAMTDPRAGRAPQS